MRESFLYLVLNLGFHSVRGIVFSANGSILKKTSRPLNTFMYGQGVEQDPLEWLTQIDSIINEIVSDVSIRNRIHYMTVTASASCLVVVDEKGKPIGKALMVADKRAYQEANQLKKIPAAVEAAEGQISKLDMTQLIPKILWWKKSNNHIKDLSQCRFLTPNDFIALHFSGQVVTDCYNAEKYLYDVKRKQYPQELLSILEINQEQLPTVVEAGTNIGVLKNEMLERYGLNKDTQYIVSTYDAICGFWGAGPSQIGDACDISGTVTSLRVLTEKNNLKSQSTNGLFHFNTEENNIVVIGGSNNLGGGLVEWLKNVFYKDHGDRVYLEMEAEAQVSLVGAKGLLFLPYLLGERAPLWDSNARGVYFGLEHYHRRPDFARALFESIGFSLLNLANSIEDNGVKINKIKASGGLSRIKLINQLKADITQKEIHVSDEVETSSLGAFLFMGKSVGLFSSLRQASAHFAQTREVIFPNSKLSDQYSKTYQLYLNLYDSLKWSFEKRSELFSEFYDGKISEHGEL